MISCFAYILVFDSDSKGEKSWKLKKTPALNTQKVSLTDLQPYTRSNLKNMNSLFLHKTAKRADYAAQKADFFRKQIYGTDVFIRGLIEVGSCCKNDCLYCGIRKSNVNAERYVLTEERILDCCREGYALGFRTFGASGR